MKIELQSIKILLAVLVIFILSCGPTAPILLTPTNSVDGSTLPATESQTATLPPEQTGDVISADNARNLVEIATWGKGSGHHPVYSPDGTLLAVSSSSGIYLYDSQTLQETMRIGTYDVLDMAFSTDGQTLSAVSGTYYDNTVTQWDVVSGSSLHSWSVDKKEELNQYTTDPIAALSPDGRTVAISFDENTVKLWDAAGGNELQTLSMSTAADVAFSADSKTLVSGEYDKVTLWNVSSGSRLSTIDQSSSYLIGLVLSPDGSRLAAGFDPGYPGGTLKVWDVASGSQLQGFSVDGDTVFCLSFSPDGKTLATGTADAIKLWDAASGNELLSMGASNLESLTFSPDGKTLVSSSSIGDDSVKLWDVETGNLLNTLNGDNVGGEVIFSSDSGTLAYAGDDNTVKLRDVAGGEVRSLSGHPDFVFSTVFSPDGKTLASGSFDEPIYSPGIDVLKLWDVASGSELRTLSGHTSWVTSVDFSPDGKTLASASADDTVMLWDVVSGSEVRTLSTPDYVYSVAFSPDGKILASGSGDNTIKLWDVASGSEVRTLSGHTAQVISIIFSPDGKQLVSQSYDGNRLWDVASGQELATLSTEMATSVISPDGKALAVGFQDGRVKVLDPANGNELYTLTGHTEIRPGLAFSPDGGILATGGEDIKLWDAVSGQELASFDIDNVYSLAFSPDGKLLLAGSLQGMSLWGIQP